MMFFIAQMDPEVQVVFDVTALFWSDQDVTLQLVRRQFSSEIREIHLEKVQSKLFSSSHRTVKSASVGGQRFGRDESWTPQQARDWRQLSEKLV